MTTEDDVVDYVLTHRWTGEDAFEASDRVIVHAALARTDGRQDAAAVLLGMSRRKVNYYAAKYKQRPKDRRVDA